MARFRAEITDDGRVVVNDDDFHYDAQLKIHGDFGSTEERFAYGHAVALALNEMPPPNLMPVDLPTPADEIEERWSAKLRRIAGWWP